MPCSNLLIVIAAATLLLLVAWGLLHWSFRVHRIFGFSVAVVIGLMAVLTSPVPITAVRQSFDPASGFCNQNLFTGQPRAAPAR